MAARPVSSTTSTCRPCRPAQAAASKPSTSSSPGTGVLVGVPRERGSSVSKAAIRGARLEAAARCSLVRQRPMLLATVAVGSLVAAGAANATEIGDSLLGSSGLALADLSIGDWFGNLLYSAGQQANEAVQDQLSALSFTSLAVIFGAGLVTRSVTIDGTDLMTYSLKSFRRYSAWINPISGAFLLGGGVYTLLDRLFPATSMVM
uniref:Uncharacterized protein n=1 Tax=Oryza rufipogon TaxID=4529 RepID=A0A0E0RDI3_ORYRU